MERGQLVDHLNNIMSKYYKFELLIKMEYLNVTYFQTMLGDCSRLEGTLWINDWNISANANFTQMFYLSPLHPEFTKVAGTCDANGTFSPNA